MAYVCITGNEKNPKDLERRIAHVLASSPRLLCELRLDYLDLTPVAAFAFLAKLPPEWAPRLVLTMRLQASGLVAGGQCDWDVQTWQSWWKDVMALRTWFAVDLDWLVLDQLAGESLDWRGKFRSRHAYFSLHATLDEVANLLPEFEASAKHHNAGVKIAVPVRGAQDLARLAHITKNLGDHPLKIIVAIGAAGKAWRWSRLTGNLSFFAYSAESRTAPGQDLLEHVLPFVSGREIPDLYVLWSQEPLNTYGEREWSRVFANRDWNARYVNIACSNVPGKDSTLEEKKIWAHSALEWMEIAGVKGASVTRPFKELFPLVLPNINETAINTLKFEKTWSAVNTDGPAVQALLQRDRVSSALVLGSGGAAKAVVATLHRAGIPATIISRLPSGALPKLTPADALISTWPPGMQEKLVAELGDQKIFRVVLDAQFQRSERESPLAVWARSAGISYVHGSVWWSEQARRQDAFWFGGETINAVRKKLWPLVPSSKSETLRALAIAAFRPGKTRILNPSICQDTEFFLHALEELGLDCEREENCWMIRSNGVLQSKETPIFVGEGAAVVRFLGALSLVIRGKSLILDAGASLRARPMEDLFSALELPQNISWPLAIPCGLPMPKKIPVDKSSQYASGFLLAAASLIWQKKETQISFDLVGELRSAPYLWLTIRMLRDVGIKILYQNNKIALSLEKIFDGPLEIQIKKDASALSYFELLSQYAGLDGFMSAPTNLEGEQSDWRFPQLFQDFLKSDKGEISLKDAPDLAPSFFAAAIFYRRPLKVIDTPQLHHKESNRATALVQAALALGISAESFSDGFSLDAREFHRPKKVRVLITHGDHRLAMAFALLGTIYPEIQPDDTACVVKSFPDFWLALRNFVGLFP